MQCPSFFSSQLDDINVVSRSERFLLARFRFALEIHFHFKAAAGKAMSFEECDVKSMERDVYVGGAITQLIEHETSAMSSVWAHARARGSCSSFVVNVCNVLRTPLGAVYAFLSS